MTPAKKYPERQVIRQFLVLKGLIAQARWQRVVNLMATAVIGILIIFVIWFFWPQINVAWSQFMAWRNQVNFH